MAAGPQGPNVSFLLSLLQRMPLPADTLAVILGAVALSGLVGFGFLAAGVLDGDTASFDERVLLAFRNPVDLTDPIGPRWFEEVMRDITGLGGNAVLFMMTVATASFLALTGRSRTVRLVLVAVVSGSVLNTGLKMLFARPRPDLVPHGMAVYTNSFPSGHALLSATVYLTLAVLLARTQPSRRVKTFIVSVALILTFLVGVSRVYLGVHWPTDVMAGWALGGAWALICWIVMIRLQRTGVVEQPPPPEDRHRV